MAKLKVLNLLLQILASFSVASTQIFPDVTGTDAPLVSSELGPPAPASVDSGFENPDNGTVEPELSVADVEEDVILLNDSSQDSNVMVAVHPEDGGSAKTPLLCSESPSPTLVSHDSPVELRVDLSQLPDPCIWSFKVDENSTSPSTNIMSEMHARILANGGGKYLADAPQTPLRLACEDLILLGDSDAGPQPGPPDADTEAPSCRRGNFLIVGDTLERSERVCGLVRDYGFTSGTGYLSIKLRAQEAGGGMGDFEMAGCVVSLL